MASDERPIVKDRTQARQGVTGHNVRWVLILGTGAVVVLFAALWLRWFA
jgi:hypothetical protein